jgi:hypothetical protein
MEGAFCRAHDLSLHVAPTGHVAHVDEVPVTTA